MATQVDSQSGDRLLRVAFRGNIRECNNIIKSFDEGKDIFDTLGSIKDGYGNTPLMKAAILGHVGKHCPDTFPPATNISWRLFC